MQIDDHASFHSYLLTTMRNKPLKSKPLPKLGGLILLSAFFLSVPARPVFASTNYCEEPIGCTPGGGKLTRTFLPHHLGKTATGATFELTRDDFLRLFAIGREIHISLSPEGETYEMNIGFTDLENPQTWQLPDIPFEGPSIWTITDPATTPHGSLYPEATHALISTNDLIAEGTVYLFYNMAETALILLGEVVEPPNEAPPEFYPYGVTLTLFPMNTTMGFFVEQSVTFDSTFADLTNQVGMHGFGSFQLSNNEILEAGAFYNDLVLRDPNEPDPNIVIDFETIYSIFAIDGTWFDFFIADPPEGDSTAIQGDVYIEDVEYWRVVDATTTAIEEEAPPETSTWSVYPNPATDVIRFSEPMSVTLYDVLGRTVGTGTSVQHLDVSTLKPGLYLVRAEEGQSKTLIIQ